MSKIRFTQIEVGPYTYLDHDQPKESHSLYGLDDMGDVYKFIPSKKVWVRVDDLDILNHNEKWN